jgi:hypothetical protein
LTSLCAQTVRIAIHRRKGTTLKLLFIVVPFFGGGFTLLSDREVVLPAIVAGRTRFAARSVHFRAFPALAPFGHRAMSGLSPLCAKANIGPPI